MPATMLKIAGRSVAVSNLAKILYPAANFTKADIFEYYGQVAPVLLPHLRNRALTLKRYPNGVTQPFFYEKEAPSHRPRWVKTAGIWSESNGRNVNYVVVNDLPTLIWVANLASLELHTPLGLIRNAERPTMVVFDLDPGKGMTLVHCSEVALALREMLASLDLEAHAKTSGSKGLQVYVPLNTAATFERSKAFAHAIATLLAKKRSDVITDMSRRLRNRKILIDWSQNTPHKTTVTAYSLRATPRPMVSTPVTWREMENCRRKRDPDLLAFGPEAVLRRVEKNGDLFAGVLKTKQRLPRALD